MSRCGGWRWQKLALALLLTCLAFSPHLAMAAWDDGAHVSEEQARAHHAAARTGQQHHHRADPKAVVVAPLDGNHYLVPGAPVDPTLGADRLAGAAKAGDTAPRFRPPVVAVTRQPFRHAATLRVISPPPRTELLA